ncbi:MAG TPA: hypothetical protein VF409_03560, partial [Sphingomonas sp.]
MDVQRQLAADDHLRPFAYPYTDDAMAHGQTNGAPGGHGLSDRFWIAPFALDGELIGVGERSFSDLSQHWIGVCESLIDHHGPVFDQPLQGPLRHLRIKCTAAGSVAMVVLYAHEVPVTSFAVVTGAAPSEEAEALTMFTEA